MFLKEIDILPMQDFRVLSFPRMWAGDGQRRYGAFYDSRLFPDIPEPVKEKWNRRLIELEVDAGRHYCGWWVKLGGVDWSEFRDWHMALRVRFSEKMFRRFKVELKQPGGGRPPGLEPRLNYIATPR